MIHCLALMELKKCEANDLAEPFGFSNEKLPPMAMVVSCTTAESSESRDFKFNKREWERHTPFSKAAKEGAA